MILKYIINTAVLILFSTSVIAFNPPKNNWGKTGHRAIGEIAQDYLKPRTKRALHKLLKGQSLALIANFADEIKSDRKYNQFYTWHFVNMPSGVTYQESKKNERGDLVTGITTCKQKIKDKNTPEEEKVFYLKMLVHLLGDLHQPFHVGHKEDLGGNRFQVRWFKQGTNMHRIWDEKMIEQYKMTYTELAKTRDKFSKTQIKALQKGSIVDWVNEMGGLATKMYTSAETGENLGYRYMYDHFGTLRKQLHVAGIRLAKVLNDLFA